MKLAFVIFIGWAVLLFYPLPPVFSDSNEKISESESNEEVYDFSKRANELLTKTLPIDISTAEYYELIHWLELLNLSTDGTRRDLQQRIAKYYGVNLLTPKIDESASISIKSSDKADYFLVEVIEENYIRLTGDVYIELQDGDITHIIQAGTILFNQKKGIIYAFGNIEYTQKSPDSEEQFHGTALVFTLEEWEGVFFTGTTTSEQSIEGENILFYFTGNEIVRKKQNRLSIDEVIVTSSDLDNPLYSIRANELWVLGPGEWATKNALLYIGRVPVLYLPFFFVPGDKLIFNPSIGFKNEEGYFLNTTTYLLGEKDPEEDHTLFSFMQPFQNIDGLTHRERSGLFMRPAEGPPEEVPWHSKTNSYIKLLADYYSRLGYFIGLEGEINRLGPLRKLNFFTGLGFSKKLYPLGDTYTIFSKHSAGDGYGPVWEETFFMGVELPFRFAFDTDFSVDLKNLSIEGKFPIYSDPHFKRQFTVREEGLQIEELLESGIQDDPRPAVMDRTTWTLNTRYRPNVTILRPFVQSFAISELRASMEWRSHQLKTSDSGAGKPAYPDMYYYPESLTWPSANVRISGTLFSTSRREDPVKTPEQDKITSDLIPPWYEIPDEEIESKDDDDDDDDDDDTQEPKSIFREASIQESIPLPGIVKQRELFNHSLSYSLTPNLLITTPFSMEKPPDKYPDSISIDADYSLLTSRNSSSIRYNARIHDQLINVSSNSAITVNYRKYFPIEKDKDDLESSIIQANRFSFVRLTNNSTLTLRPLLNYRALSSSNITYNLQTTLYELTYDEDIDKHKAASFDWDADYISRHRITTDVDYKTGIHNHRLRITSNLPPLQMEVDPSLTLRFGPSTTFIRTGFTQDQDDNTWSTKPVEVREKIDFFQNSYFEQRLIWDLEDSTNNKSSSALLLRMLKDNIRLNQTLSWDLYNQELEESTTRLNLWWLSFTLQAANTHGYNLAASQQAINWQRTDPEFQPTRFTSGLSYKYDPPPFWKNRLEVSAGFDSSLHIDMLRFTDTVWDFSFSFNLWIAEFLDLTIRSKSINRAVYQYISSYRDELNAKINVLDLPELNPITDLLKSFNFFNPQHRRESNFKLQSLSLLGTHQLKDWELNFEYYGIPELEEEELKYTWKPRFSIFVQWKPIPELKREISYEDGLFDF